ncbi:MAG: polyphenol oxidase family protein [Calditrichaceae bacterium]
MEPIHVIQFGILKSCSSLVHAFSTRKGGFSQNSFKSLNLGLTTGDNPYIVQKNRNTFFKYLHIDPANIVYPGQIHSNNIHLAEEPGIAANCDALITGKPNLFLSIQTADCFPVFLYEPVKQVIAIIHSGWKGTAADIAGRTVQKMTDEFYIHPENLLAGIGPGVQKQNFQVDDPVFNQFDPRYFSVDGPGHYKMDLQQAIVDQLVHRGV